MKVPGDTRRFWFAGRALHLRGPHGHGAYCGQTCPNAVTDDQALFNCRRCLKRLLAEHRKPKGGP